MTGDISHYLELDDLFRLRWLSEPRLSPDGKRVAFVASGLDRERDEMFTQICLVATAAECAEPVCLTPPGAHDASPRWAGDSRRLAVISNRGGDQQIWVLDTVSGSSTQITQSAHGTAEPVWSPDASWLAYSALTVDDPPEGPTVDTVGWLRYKTDGVGVDLVQRRRHIWRVPSTGGASVPVTSGAWNDTAPAWSPDGSYIAFLSNRTDRRDLSFAADIWLTACTGDEAWRLTDTRGPTVAFAWSPDARSIAYVGHDNGDAEGVNQQLFLVDVADGATRCLTASLDRSIGTVVRADDPRGGGVPDIGWSADGARIYFTFTDGGSSHVGWATPDGCSGVSVASTGACLSFSVAHDKLAYIAADVSTPGELFLTSVDGQDKRRLTAYNDEWLHDIQLGDTIPMSVRADDGWPIEGWLVRPPDAAPGRRYPLIVQVHGGPHYALGNRFYFEFQRLAAQGYAVLYGNPRGSQGYGQAHATQVLGDWGGRDFRDVMQLVDAAIATGHVDPERLGVNGVSYGGFMVNWIVSHEKRFRAAIAENSISNFVSVFGTSAGLDPFWCSEFGGLPWEQPALYHERSPLTHVAQIQTPLLLIHAELDQQCPIGQSEELFTALRLLGREVEFVRIPGEGHLVNLVGRPSRRLRRAAVVDGWLGRHLRDRGGDHDDPCAPG